MVRIEPAGLLKEGGVVSRLPSGPNPDRGTLSYRPAGPEQSEAGGQPRRPAVTAQKGMVEKQAVCAA